MNHSRVLAFALLIFVVGLLAGCGSGPEPSATLAPTQAQQVQLATATVAPQPSDAGPGSTSVPASPTSPPLPTITLPTVVTVEASPTEVPEPVQPTASGPSPLFGLQLSSVSQEGGLDRVLDAAVHWLRLTPFDWDKIEPERTEPPTYKWAVVDDTVQGKNLVNASANGLEVIAVIRFSPEWARDYPGHFCAPIKPQALAAYAQFLRELVARYSQEPFNVKYWELGNEPDIDHVLVGGSNGYGCWGDYDDEYYGGRYYAEMLKVAYPAIKEADPEAEVLIGGLLLDCDSRNPEACVGGSHGDVPPRFLEGVLVNDGGDYFDILSFHAYADNLPAIGGIGSWTWPGATTTVPEKAAFVREVLQKYGHGDKPLMNTEAALRCREVGVECFDWQATYITRAYADAMAADLMGQIYFALINEHWYSTGLLNPDLSPKPGYGAFKTASQMLGQAEYVGLIDGYPPGLAGHTFWRPDMSQYLDVVWSVDGTMLVVALPPDATARDRYGTAFSASTEIQVDSAPVYITRP